MQDQLTEMADENRPWLYLAGVDITGPVTIDAPENSSYGLQFDVGNAGKRPALAVRVYPVEVTSLPAHDLAVEIGIQCKSTSMKPENRTVFPGEVSHFSQGGSIGFDKDERWPDTFWIYVIGW